MAQVSDINVLQNLPLPAPELLTREIPASEANSAFVATARAEINEAVFEGGDRLLMVIGPCSIHDLDAGREYADRLAQLAEKVRERLVLVMRVYFEKPRTTVGWKGLIMDPHLDGSNDIPTGLRTARKFLREVLDRELPTATELLDPITPQYIADLICWSAIGARTSESQTHRQMASGLSMPLGIKNATSGAIEPAINAIKAASQSQTFLGVSPQGIASAVTTRGNPHCHVILRGGDRGPNYGADDVAETRQLLADAGLPQTVMIDASHGNSSKDHRRQPEVLREIVRQRVAGNRAITGAMVESNLVEGGQKFPQPLENLVYGQSITDKCIGWEDTEQLLLEVAEMLG